MARHSWAIACIVACGLAATGRAATQSVDEVVAKNIEAKGGLARIKGIQTIRQTSTMTMQGMEASMTVYAKRPNLMRQEVTVAGQRVVNAFDGATPWVINPLVGVSRPIALSGPQADVIREQADFDGPLVDYRAKGYTVEHVGLESLGERQVHHLRLTSRTRQVSHLYLDATSFLEVKDMKEMDQLRLEQEFGDYRTIDGITVPFLIRTLTNGVPQSETRVLTVEFNLTVDDAIFRMPRG